VVPAESCTGAMTKYNNCPTELPSRAMMPAAARHFDNTTTSYNR
jgi:hypothetical protein